MILLAILLVATLGVSSYTCWLVHQMRPAPRPSAAEERQAAEKLRLLAERAARDVLPLPPGLRQKAAEQLVLKAAHAAGLEPLRNHALIAQLVQVCLPR